MATTKKATTTRSARKSTKATARKAPAKSKAADPRGTDYCRFRPGKYGVPKSAKACPNSRVRPRIMCTDAVDGYEGGHDQWWKEQAPKRAAAKKARYVAAHPEAAAKKSKPRSAGQTE